ncbi:MAG: hypothetical protein DI587_17130 [Variovorax paradoxus]|nr:MAG: hypothetical protein DI583_17130 [Variovorax paradoxus]PZQ08958.1 MAG: hypothetical protein DI587_17130 [Variovorax paradoxus]
MSATTASTFDSTGAGVSPATQAGACPFPLRCALTHPCGTWSAHGLVRTWPFTRSLRQHIGRERQA